MQMVLCKILVFLMVPSLLVVSFSAFQLSPSMRSWIDKAMQTASVSLLELAKLSTDEALIVFSRFFAGVAALAFVLYILADKYMGPSSQQLFAFTFMLFFYTSVSLNAWNRKRAEILKKFMGEAAKDTVRYVRFFVIFAAVVLVITALISAQFGIYTLEHYGPLYTFLGLALLAIVAAVWATQTLSLLVAFGPAIVAIAYLWLSIYLARLCLLIGSRRMVNFLVAYAIFGTLYFLITSFPALRESLQVPALCY